MDPEVQRSLLVEIQRLVSAINAHGVSITAIQDAVAALTPTPAPFAGAGSGDGIVGDPGGTPVGNVYYDDGTFAPPTGGAPSGAAGGDLSGTYPNPGVQQVQGVLPTTLGLDMLSTLNAASGRSLLGLGTLSTQDGLFTDELSSIAGLTSAADTVPYYTGAGTAALATFTAAGRAIVDDADAAAQRTTLGLGTLATQSGTFSGTSSGTNTGDQTITLTGAVTGTGTGSFATTLAAHATSHKNGGGDEIATATPTADCIPKAGALGELHADWLPVGTTVNKGALKLGSSAGQACEGNDSRLSDSRAPNGSAGGDLTGTYPNPTFNTSVVTAAAKTVLDDATVSAMVDTLGGTAAQGTGAIVRATSPTITSPTFAAGSASASSWPKLTAGTVMSTAEDGAIEMDADCIYACTDAGNRGYVPVRHFIRADGTRNLPNNTNLNAIFNSPANGRLTLETGTYMFEMLIQLTAMSGSSGNAQIDILGAGGATMASVLYYHTALDNSSPSAIAAFQSAVAVTKATPAAAATAGTGTGFNFYARGSFEITGAGTIVPSVKQANAAAATLSIGSFFACERIGSTSVVSVGQWD